MGMLGIRFELFRQLITPCVRDGRMCFYRHGRFYVETPRVSKRRSGIGEADEVPIQPTPIKTERICYQYRLVRSGGISNPFSRGVHSVIWAFPCFVQLLSIQSL